MGRVFDVQWVDGTRYAKDDRYGQRFLVQSSVKLPRVNMEIIAWLLDNVKGQYFVCPVNLQDFSTEYLFSNLDDAMLFKLVWVE